MVGVIIVKTRYGWLRIVAAPSKAQETKARLAKLAHQLPVWCEPPLRLH